MEGSKSGPVPNEHEARIAREASEDVVKAKQKAAAFQDQVRKAADSAERQRMLQDAYDNEVIAHGQSKVAWRLQSGTWQGAVGGAWIGGGVGVGLGTVVGTLVGGVVSIPTTALGGLTGAAVGGLHGPWIKVDRKAALERREARLADQAREKGDEEVAAAHEKAQADFRAEIAAAQDQAMQHDVEGAHKAVEAGRKKPRKLEVRSAADSSAARKVLPRKLENRSGGK